jgi:cytochrome c553
MRRRSDKDAEKPRAPLAIPSADVSVKRHKSKKAADGPALPKSARHSEPRSAWQLLKPDMIWLRQSVSWETIVARLAILVALVGVFAAIFVIAGGINIYADEPDSFIARHLLHFVFKRSVASRATSLLPPDDLSSPSRVRLGAQHFDMVCANCHGGPGLGQSVVALSMSPRPQNLPKVVGQFTDAELYLIVKHGVKYSAMPSWPTSERADEIWSMVSFLRQLPKMDSKNYAEMTALPEKAASPASASVGAIALRPANTERNSPPVEEFLYAAPAIGFADENFHANPAATCARCHGADGTGAATGGEAPNLTIQDASYLKSSLAAYTSGARKSGFMQNIAAQLSTEQVNALSDYYAGLPVKTVPSQSADPALAKRGEIIATQGIRERAIPACANCHDSAGSAIVGAPHIAGQSATFLKRQLGALRLGGRGSTVSWNPMSAEAHHLADNDIDALAAFYSGLQPAKAAGAANMPHAMLPQGDMAVAKALFETRCVKCHANVGRGDPEGGFPDLTIQSAPYIAQNLFSFRTRARTNNKMEEVVDVLNFDDMTSLANYVGSLAPQKALVKVDADAAARGAAIATNGLPARNVPACLNCHGDKGTSALPLIPRLQGQSVVYMTAKLDEFAGPLGENINTLNPMPAIAAQLTSREREDLAAYFAAQAPLEKTAR